MARGVPVGLGRASRWVAALALAVFLVVLAALLPGLGRQAHADTGDDSLLVYCLSPAQRAGLLDAAAALGYAKRDGAGGYVLTDGGPPDPAAWYQLRRDDFMRTCKALFAAHRVPEPGVFASVLPFLTGLTGALLAFLAATWRDRVARGHALADGLRTAFNGYGQALETYFDSYGPNRSDAQVVERRYGLLLELGKARASHRHWPLVAEVETEIERHEPKGTGAPERDKRQAMEWLREVKGRVFQIAEALDRPMRRNAAMRSTSTGGA